MGNIHTANQIIRGPQWTALQAVEESRRLVALREVRDSRQYCFNDRRAASVEVAKLETIIMLRARALEAKLRENADVASVAA